MSWGKTDLDNPNNFHHLVHHCADVAAVFGALVTRTDYRRRLETAAGRALSDRDVDRLTVLVFLHDVGKLIPGFQRKNNSAIPSVFSQGNHAQAGLDLTHSRSRKALAIPRLVTLDRVKAWTRSANAYKNLAHAVFSHHGTPISNALPQNLTAAWRDCPAYDPVDAATTYGQCLQSWLGGAFVDDGSVLPDCHRFVTLFAGLVTLADWIGSDRHIFAYRAALDPSYWAEACDRAAEALARFKIDQAGLKAQHAAPASFKTLTRHANPNGVQRAVAELATDHRLVILEAETGSGKTEAALIRWLRLWEAGAVEGLYFALPTRAAAMQLHKRVTDAAQNVFKDQAPEPVLAVPGYYRAGLAEGRPLPNYQVFWDDGAADAQARRWAAEQPKRTLAAPIAVGTVDQAMLGALQVRHAHLRHAALSRSLLVIDEVHASDRYMTEVQRNLLDLHLGVGGHALLMSATLGTAARVKWQGWDRPDHPHRMPSLKAAETAPYPAVWIDRDVTPIAPEPSGRSKAISMAAAVTENPDDMIGPAIAAARAGAKVLIVRNTVDLAVHTLQAAEAAGAADLLLSVGGVATLHHGRFAKEDRALLDTAVEDALGKDRSPGGALVIGTQTLEQSLDIDADLLITDLCPADVLLQRLGRLHRHNRDDRPAGFTAPACTVLVPKGWPEPALTGWRMVNGLGVFERDGGVEGIYEDLIAIELTRRLVAERAVWTIPDDNRLLVERATHPDAQAAFLAGQEDAWSAFDVKRDGTERARAGAASEVRLPVDAPFSGLTFPTRGEEVVRTRLGDPGMPIKLPDPVPGPFGSDIQTLTIPARWVHRLATDSLVTIQPRAAELELCIEENYRFIYNRLGLKRDA